MRKNLQKEQDRKQKNLQRNLIISVSVGEGLSQIFRELGVDYLIEGGQTMNPSTEACSMTIEKSKMQKQFIFSRITRILSLQLTRQEI